MLLQKTLLYVEGVGRQLYPQLDLWKTAKPFLESWIKDQVGIPALVRAFKEKAPFWVEKMPVDRSARMPAGPPCHSDRFGSG